VGWVARLKAVELSMLNPVDGNSVIVPVRVQSSGNNQLASSL
jgi:hypothetical protein